MKIQKRSSRKKKIIITSIIVALLIGGGVFAYTQSPLYAPDEEDTTSEDREDENGNTEENGEGTVDTNGTTTDDTHLADPTDNLDRDPSENTPTESSARISIPNYQASGDTISVSVAISEVWGDGQCTLRVEGPRAASATDTVFPQAQISGCQPTISGLPGGTYRATVYAERNGQRTNTDTLTINL